MHHQKGFSLVEMAVVLLIVGLVVGAFFAFYTPYLEQTRQQTTVERQNRIARALSDYAERQGYLPCPGNPNAALLGTAGTCSVLPGGTPVGSDGIVPFRVLGLSQQDVTDGFGNPFTYAISPYMASSSGVSGMKAHANCRDAIWNPSGVANLNRPKALLCCKQMYAPANSGFLEVFNDISLPAGSHIVPINGDPQTWGVTNPVAANYLDPDSTVSTPPYTTDNITYFAYILISHGKNGEGAYIFGKSLRRPFMRAGDGEMQNAGHNINGSTTDVSYVDLPRNETVDNEYYDDIVLWRTQQGMISELGGSCATP